MFRYLLAIVLASALCACASQSTKPLATAHQQIEAACLGVSTSYGLAAVASDKGKLSAAQQADLKTAAAITDKVCENIPYQWADVPANFYDAKNTLDTLGALK